MKKMEKIDKTSNKSTYLSRAVSPSDAHPIPVRDLHRPHNSSIDEPVEHLAAAADLPTTPLEKIWWTN